MLTCHRLSLILCVNPEFLGIPSSTRPVRTFSHISCVPVRLYRGRKGDGQRQQRIQVLTR